jgi:hypothetical protein
MIRHTFLLSALVLALVSRPGVASAVAGGADSAAAVPRAPGTDSLASPDRVERWRADLRFLGDELPRRHGDLFWRTPAAVFRSRLDSLVRAVPESPDWRLVAGVAQLCAIADAHTTLQWGDSAAHFRHLPIQIAGFEEGWFVVATDSAHVSLLGTRLVTVGDLPADHAAGALAPYLSYENEAWLGDRLGPALGCPELITVAGRATTPDSVAMRFDDGHGAILATTLVALPAGSRPRWLTVFSEEHVPVPVARRDPALAYWFRVLPETRALLFRYNACIEMDTLGFERFAARVWAAADSARVERVIVDLRANAGGRSTLWEPFVRGLTKRSALARPDRLAVLISSRTFSSAVLDAWEVHDRATLIGQPTGGKPNGWGEVKTFRLPRTGLLIQYSTRYFRLIRDADPPSLVPDVAVPLRWDDYRSGRDQVLDRALAR